MNNETNQTQIKVSKNPEDTIKKDGERSSSSIDHKKKEEQLNDIVNFLNNKERERTNAIKVLPITSSNDRAKNDKNKGRKIIGITERVKKSKKMRLEKNKRQTNTIRVLPITSSSDMSKNDKGKEIKIIEKMIPIRKKKSKKKNKFGQLLDNSRMTERAQQTRTSKLKEVKLKNNECVSLSDISKTNIYNGKKFRAKKQIMEEYNKMPEDEFIKIRRNGRDYHERPNDKNIVQRTKTHTVLYRVTKLYDGEYIRRKPPRCNNRNVYSHVKGNSGEAPSKSAYFSCTTSINTIAKYLVYVRQFSDVKLLYMVVPNDKFVKATDEMEIKKGQIYNTARCDNEHLIDTVIESEWIKNEITFLQESLPYYGT